MNFSFLKRVPKNKRFFYEPRYYDPIKEEIKYRTETIRKEISREKKGNYHSMISEGFARKERRASKASSMQLILIALLIGGFTGYIYFGNTALWIFMGLFAVYIFIRTRKIFD